MDSIALLEARVRCLLEPQLLVKSNRSCFVPDSDSNVVYIFYIQH